MKTRTSLRLLTLAVLALLGAALAACGEGSGNGGGGTTAAAGATATTAADAAPADRLPERTEATLVLDFVPNAVHAGIYRALEAGYYEARNIDLRVIEPTSTADTLRLIDAGKADVGLADAIDVAGQIDRGLDIEAFLAVVQRPLGGIVTLADDGIADGADLEGRTVGVTGVPSDGAVLDTIVEDAGGDPSAVRVVTIGFNGAQNLRAGKIDGFTGYWPADATQLDVDGARTRSLKLDEHGGPVYPGLVAFSTREHLAQDPDLIRAFAAATAQGYADAIADPEQALADLLRRNPALRADLARAQLDAYGPLFQADAARFGALDPAAVAGLSRWMVERRLVRRAFAPERFGGDAFLPEG